ncbi:MAG: TIR domain-containing protein, partial [Polymorphobacter sp.]
MSVPSVFISYARVDRARVAKIAAALTAAGHKVWWDAAIEVGSAFASDIARALDAADVVVVAWSAKSVTSGWVLDEAGAGRDRHRLVPLLLDGTTPPLGFRQLHGIDLSGGRERKPAVLAELVSVVERVAVSGTNDGHPATLLRKNGLSGALPWLLALAVATLIALISWQWLVPRFGPPDKPVVAVMPFLDMSAAKGEAYFAEGLAEEILDTLALDARLKVLGRTTAWAMRDKVGDPTYLRTKLGVTRLLEGSVRGGGSGSNDRVKVSVRLIDTSDGTEIWSQVFDRSAANVLAVQEEVAAAVAAQLAGPAADSARPQVSDSANLPPKVYENLLVARQLIRTRQVDALARARALAEAAIAAAPDYAPAHAARSMATVLLTVYGDLAPDPALGEARAEAETAIRLDPRLSEGYTALGNTLISLNDPTSAIAALSRATKLRPNNSEARMLLGRVLMDNGQVSRAITELELAVASDPLWITPTVNLIRAYGLANQLGKIRALEASFRALSPDPADAELVASDAALATGDYARALQLADAALSRNPKLTNAKSSRNNALLPLL